MHLLLRNNASYFGLYDNDCPGNTTVTPDRWHHLAFVYDYVSREEYLYLNGVLDCHKPSKGPFLATEGNITVGTISDIARPHVVGYWKGRIDQVSYTPRAKNASEILWDATLVAYYSFDGTTDFHLDSGPNGIHGVSDGESIMKRVFRLFLDNLQCHFVQRSNP